MFAVHGEYHTLRIVDFGLATETTVEKYMFPKCGTPGYVAPEVLNLANRSEKYSQQCDLFSCGCIFYKLYHPTTTSRLTGRSLFPGTQFNEVLKLNKACDIDLLLNAELEGVSPDAMVPMYSVTCSPCSLGCYRETP
jgi:serine/threonine protein kinase